MNHGTPVTFAEAPTVRTLLTLAWPIILARATQAVIGFADALQTAPLGEEALAAVTTGAINTMNAIVLPMGLVFIVQSFAAQLKGRGELVAARRYAYYALLLAGISGVLAIAALPLVGPALSLFPYAPRVHELMTEYMTVRLVGVGLIVGTEALGNWYGGLGQTTIQMRAGMVAMVANVGLNYLLIEGHLGAPALGVAGAAWASTIASGLGFAIVAWPFVRSARADTGTHVFGGSMLRSLRRAELFRMLRFGLPNGVNWFLEFGAFSLFLNVAVAHLGTTTLAAMNVVIQVNCIAFMPAFGLASAGAILVGQSLGRGAPDEVPRLVRTTTLVAALWMGTVGLVYLLFPSAIFDWFRPRDVPAETLTALGASLLAVSTAWQLFDAVVMTVAEALRAAGDTAWCMWARVANAWLLFVPCGFLVIFVLGGGPIAAVLCLVAYVASLAALMVWRFRRGAWRRIDLVGAEAPLV